MELTTTHASPPPRRWQLLLVLLGMLTATVALLYRDAFLIKPVGDDFELVSEIHRGDRDGALSLYTRSLTSNFYRPSKSFTIWLTGRGSEQGRSVRIRAAHVVLTIPYVIALTLWLSLVRARWPSAIVGGMALLMHPGMVATLSSIDGCGGMVASGLIWIGAWFIATGERRHWLSIALASLCFIVGVTWKEYIFSLVPLAGFTALTFRKQRRWISALQVTGVLMSLFLIQLALRNLIMPGGTDHSARLVSLSPAHWLWNAGLALGGLTFLGNTLGLFLNRSVVTVCTAGAAVVLVLAWIVAGLRTAAASERAHVRDEHAEVAIGPQFPQAGPRGWIVFLVLSTGVVMFPAVLHTNHFAEKYLCPLLLPFALLCALAASGWLQSRARPLAAVAVLSACISACAAILDKNASMREAGRMAESQCLQMLEFLGPNPNHRHILAVFGTDVLQQPAYSVYRFRDNSYVMPRTPFLWWRPASDLGFDEITTDNLFAIDMANYDLVVRWDPRRKRFDAIKPLAPTFHSQVIGHST
jgi:hypothetical protein